MLSLLAAAAIVAFAEPAPAPEGGVAAAAPVAAKPKAKFDKVCWDEAPTGSHYVRHYCATREELEQRAREDQDAISRRGRNPGQGGLKPN